MHLLNFDKKEVYASMEYSLLAFHRDTSKLYIAHHTQYKYVASKEYVSIYLLLMKISFEVYKHWTYWVRYHYCHNLVIVKMHNKFKVLKIICYETIKTCIFLRSHCYINHISHILATTNHPRSYCVLFYVYRALDYLI